MSRRFLVVAATCGLGSQLAAAQPAPELPDKQDAQALVASGMKLFGVKDFLGALAVFRDAYMRFPSTKILLNIATTLARLDREADAANTYQRYLDAQDTDPAKRAGVEKALEELDARLALVTITVTPIDAEIQIGDKAEWLPAQTLSHYRVAPGDVIVSARGASSSPSSKPVHLDAGGELTLTFALVAKPVVTAVTPRPGVPLPAPRSRLGAVVLAHVAVEHPGAAGLVGLTYDARPAVQLELTALIGKTSGGYVAVAFEPLHGRVRPLAVLGAPLFVSHGARISLRGGLGLEARISRNVSAIAEVAIERALNPEVGVEKTTFVPALGITARL